MILGQYRQRSILSGLLLIAAFALPGLAAEKIQIMVSLPPQTYFVQQIAGDLAQVSSLIPAGASVHTYEPTPKDMRQLSRAQMYVRIHVEVEDAWWEKIAAVNPKMLTVDSTVGVDWLEGAEHQHDEETAPPTTKDDAHDHHGRDPHIWLSPQRVKLQAETIYAGLVQLDPAHQAAYRAKTDAFLTQLDALDAEIHQRLANLKTRKFVVFHPSWGYFARDYDLEQIAIENEGKEPSVAEMAELIKLTQAQQVRVIFVQPQTSRRSAETIAKQIGAKVETLDPLAADWLENLRDVTHQLEQALGSE